MNNIIPGETIALGSFISKAAILPIANPYPLCVSGAAQTCYIIRITK